MKMLIQKRLSIIFLFFFLTQNFHAQPLSIRKIIAENKITTYYHQRLILVDFWATWCVPCEYANQQLEILQERNRDKIFMMSISNEEPDIIRQHVEKMNMKLMILADDNVSSFQRYNVNALPYSVVYNTKGNIVWQGMPSDLNENILSKLYNENADNKNELDKYIAVVPETIIIKKDSLIPPLNTNNELANIAIDTATHSIKIEKKDTCIISPSETLETSFYIEKGAVFFNGKISALMEILFNISKHQIKINEEKNKCIQIKTSLDYWNTKPTNILNTISNLYNLKVGKSKKLFNAWSFDIKQLKYDKRIDMKDATQGIGQEYMIDDDKLLANGLSIKKVAALLGDLLSTIVVCDYCNEANLFFWDIHYQPMDLLKKELYDNYGILLKKHISVRDIYVIH